MTKPIDKLTTSTTKRRLSIAKAGLNIGKSWVKNNAINVFQSKEQRQITNQAFVAKQAQYLVEELGKLKGSVVKIGQMLALYGESMLPKEVVAALHTLDDNTAPVAWQSIYNTIHQELGDKIHLLEINPNPIGTASLAQVHKAIIKATGEPIVLKVQYPNIAKAIDSDLSLFKGLLKVTNIVPQTRALDEWFDEIQRLLHSEVDYQKEANTAERFFARLQDDHRYIVPKIYRKFCTPTLLAMSFEMGVNLSDPVLSNLPITRRNQLGQAALEIVIKEIFEWNEMQTDPNFGNYLVQLDEVHGDRLVLLDFGAMKLFDQHLINIAQNLLKAGYYQNKNAMIAAMTGYDFFDKMSTTVKSDMADVFLMTTEPFAHPKQLTHTNCSLLDNDQRYIWAKSDLYNRTITHAKKGMQSLEFSLPPKEMMFISRKFVGAYAFLSAIDARTDADELIGKYIEPKTKL